MKVSKLCEDYVVPQSTLYKWLHESTTYLRRESLSHKWYQSIEALEQDVEEFVSFFNGFRPLSRLRNLTPDEYERRYFEKKTAYENETHEIIQFFQTI